MNKAILIIDMPETCSDCFFCGDVQELSVGANLYKKISRCILAKDIEDPWRDLCWQLKHKEDWCPIKEIPEKYNMDAPHDRDYDMEYEYGYNACIDEILGDD